MNLLDNYKKNSFEDIFYPNVPFETGKINCFKGYLLSVKMLILHPFVFYKLMHVNKGYTKPLIFALINIVISVIVSDVYMYYNLSDTPKEQLQQILQGADQLPVAAQSFLQNMEKQMPPFTFDFSSVVLQCVGELLNMLVLVMICQTALLVLRLADNGMQATWRVICYATVALLIDLIPMNLMLNNTILLGGGFLLVIIGLSEAHELTCKRTLLAAVSLPVAFLLLLLPIVLK